MRDFIVSIQWRTFFREIIIMALIFGAMQFLLPRSVVQGHSMEPNLVDGQRLAGSPIPYIFGEPQRGDIVMLYPVEEDGPNLVKRIIGLPGERIYIEAGQVYVNDELIEEVYLQNGCQRCNDGTWLLSENELFVMGDNRPSSYDSRNYGAVSIDKIMGKVLFRWYPLNELNWFSN